MLKDNIRVLRRQKGLSQEELSENLHVVRQTVSKWEQGLSVPDAEMLISISKELDTSVSTLLGSSLDEERKYDIKEISEKLEKLNMELVRKKENKRKCLHYLFITFTIILVCVFIFVLTIGDSYMEWDYSIPEFEILGVAVHSFVWIFIRLLPIIFALSVLGIYLTRKKK